MMTQQVLVNPACGCVAPQPTPPKAESLTIEKSQFTLRMFKKTFEHMKRLGCDFEYFKKLALKYYTVWINDIVYIGAFDTQERKFVFWEARKRGSSVYIKWLLYKFNAYFKTVVKFCKKLHLWKFLTLTVPERQHESIEAFRERLNSFWTALKNRVKRRTGRRLFYFKVYELQKDGSLHTHYVVYGLRKSDIPTSWLLKNWDGRNNIKPCYSLYGVFKYIQKYLLKGHDNKEQTALFWANSIRTYSTNFHHHEKLVSLLPTTNNSNVFIGFGVWKTNFVNIGVEKMLEYCKAQKWYGVIYWFNQGDEELFVKCLAEAFKMQNDDYALKRKLMIRKLNNGVDIIGNENG
jgi:hypothetical protein